MESGFSTTIGDVPSSTTKHHNIFRSRNCTKEMMWSLFGDLQASLIHYIILNLTKTTGVGQWKKGDPFFRQFLIHVAEINWGIKLCLIRYTHCTSRQRTTTMSSISTTSFVRITSNFKIMLKPALMTSSPLGLLYCPQFK